MAEIPYPSTVQPVPSQEQPREDPMAIRGRLESASRAGTQSAYLGDRTMLCRVLNKYMFVLDSTDRALGPHLLLNGYWESWITLAFHRLVQPGMVCIDVGANVGYHTITLADLVGPGGAVLGFEPNPRCAELLKETVLLNGFQNHTVISNHAVSDTVGATVHLSVEQGRPMNGTIVGRHSNEEVVEVQTVTIDSVSSGLPRVDLIKIDVEGAEEGVWDGMQETLRRNPAMKVILEFNGGRGDPVRFLGKIQNHYPTLRHIDFDGSIVELTREEALHGRGCEDWMMLLAK